MAFDWVGSAIQNKPQRTKLLAVVAALVRVAVWTIALLVLAACIGVYLGFIAKVFLWFWGMGW